MSGTGFAEFLAFFAARFSFRVLVCFFRFSLRTVLLATMTSLCFLSSGGTFDGRSRRAGADDQQVDDIKSGGRPAWLTPREWDVVDSGVITSYSCSAPRGVCYDAGAEVA